MRFIGGVIEKLQRHPKRIVFPEGAEPRVLQAARQFFSLRLGAPILLGDRTKIKETAEALNISLEGIRIINPTESDDLDNFARRFEILRRYKGMKSFEAREAMMQPNYFGAMMVAMHQADGLVSGTNEISGSVLRPLFQIIKVAPQQTTASSCMVMEVEDTRFGQNGVMFMADCGVIPDPTVSYTGNNATGTISFTPVGDASGSANPLSVVMDGYRVVIARFGLVPAAAPLDDPIPASAFTRLAPNPSTGPVEIRFVIGLVI